MELNETDLKHLEFALNEQRYHSEEIKIIIEALQESTINKKKLLSIIKEWQTKNTGSSGYSTGRGDTLTAVEDLILKM